MCDGSRACTFCDGKGYTLNVPGTLGAQVCTFCDYGTCHQCGGEGQVENSWARPARPPQSITFEQGHEFAADSPWGFQRLRVSTDGTVEFEHRARGIQNTTQGTVDPELVRAVRAALSTTTFPQKPQETFLPGTSIIKIATSPPTYSVLIDYFEGMKLDGYRDVIRALSELSNALREGDATTLSAWHFVPSSPSSTP